MIKNKKIIFVFVLIIFLGVFATSVFAQDSTEYKLLEPSIPYIGAEDGYTTAGEFLPGIFKLVIALAAVLAVGRIIYAGFQYISTEAFGKKSDAKQAITGAIGGLVLIISSWLILNTINPELVKFDLSIEGLKVGENFDLYGGSDGGDEPSGQERGENLNSPTDQQGCVNCIQTEAYDFPQKLAPFGCGQPSGTSCLINLLLATKLQNLIVLNPDLKDTFQVTEMFPHTEGVTHSHPCHNSNTSVAGMCVDLALRNLGCANTTACPVSKLRSDANKISTFVQALVSSGVELKPVYEVSNNERRTGLVNAGVPGQYIIVVPRENFFEHFSVYLDNNVYSTR